MNQTTTPLVEAGFEQVAELAEQHLVDAGGGALCVYLDGAAVLDVWAGKRDPVSGDPWLADTMAMSWSTTKGLASTAIHLLADRGQLGYDDAVSVHWPEFGANNKADITIRQILTMQAGLYDVRHLTDDPNDLVDHTTMAAALAAAEPQHQPGTANAYHAWTYGWLAGELVRRITGASLGAFVQSEMAEPLGLDGCYIGTPTEELGRVAARPNLSPLKPSVRRIAKVIDPISRLIGLSPARIAAAFIPNDGHLVIPTTEFLQAEIPSVNGVFTARSLARLYAALGSPDGIDGHQLWSSDTCREVATIQTSRKDRVIPIKMGWQLGYHRPFPRKACSPSAFGFYGSYGSGAFADPDRRLAVGLTVQEAKGLPMLKLVKPIMEAAKAANH